MVLCPLMSLVSVCACSDGAGVIKFLRKVEPFRQQIRGF
jgi:hypothetical protein